ncbi:MAG: hypothetical protein Q7S27_02855 [Nanoarchaeota archaeon]|nr:hypothetical protein [Nanoarchaeota archaeon]
MVKKIIFSLFILILILSFANAVSTDIKVKTLADHKVGVFIYSSGQPASIDSFHKVSDSSGIVQVTHSSDKSKIDVMIKITKDGKNVLDPYKFEDYKAGDPIYIRYDFDEQNGEYSDSTTGEIKEAEVNDSAIDANTTIPAAEEKTEEAVKETVKEENKSGEVNQPATGGVISHSDGDFFSWMIYGGIGLLLIVIVAVLFVWRSSHFSTGIPSPPTHHFSGSHNSNSVVQEQSYSDIHKVEKRLEEAQREIRMLKNKEKIKEAENRLRQDKDELDRLRRGEA